MSGVNAYRLNGVLVGGEVVTGDGNDGLLHELIHGVSGYSYHAKLDAAITGDNIHVPGECKYLYFKFCILLLFAIYSLSDLLFC